MSDQFIGQIMQVGFNFAPRNWATCDGQIMSIAQNTALFSLLGTFYGGNGQTTFALPDLRGRRMVHQGQGPGLQAYTIGEVAGAETTTLLQTNMPAHTHTMAATFSVSGPQPKASAQAAAANFVLGHSDDIAVGGTSKPAIYCPAGTTANIPLGGLNVSAGISGGSLPFSILDPFLVINCIIALQGIFPSRN